MSLVMARLIHLTHLGCNATQTILCSFAEQFLSTTKNVMTYTAEHFIATNQANAHALKGLSITAFSGFENVVELNLSASKAVMGESFTHLKAILGAKDIQELLALQTGLFQAVSEKAAAYGQQVCSLVTDTGVEFTKAFEIKLAESQTAFNDAVENFAKNAPAGSEPALVAFNSAVSAGQSVIDSAQSSAKKVLELTESNLKAANTANMR